MIDVPLQLVDEAVDMAVDVTRLEPGLRRKVSVHLRLLERDLVEQIQDLGGEPGDAARLAHLERKLGAVRRSLGKHYSNAAGALQVEMFGLAHVTRDAARTMLNTVLGGSVAAVGPTLQDLKTLARDTHILGGPAKDHWGLQEHRLRDAFAREMRTGILAGETNQQLITRIRGGRTGGTISATVNGETIRLPKYSGGIMDVSRNQADALVRTSVQTVSNQTMLATYQANSDILRGMQALATLDTRTTPVCMSRDGAKWSNEGDPLPGSPRNEPFPGPPPWHWRCRSVLVPLTKSWDEIMDSPAARKADRTIKSPEVRASMGGPVTGKTTFHSWLKRQPIEVQQDKLGMERWTLWKNGKITIHQLTDMQGRELSITDLRQRRGLVKQKRGGSE